MHHVSLARHDNWIRRLIDSGTLIEMIILLITVILASFYSAEYAENEKPHWTANIFNTLVIYEEMKNQNSTNSSHAFDKLKMRNNTTE